MRILIIIAIALGLGAALVAASGNALPSDALYGLKARYAEGVRGLFVVGSDAKTAWLMERAERRIEEVERLAIERRLTTDTRLRLQERFIRLADLVDSRLEAYLEKDAVTGTLLASRFKAALDGHEVVLTYAGFSGEDLEEKAEILSFQEAVDGEGNDASSLRSRLEIQTVDKQPAEVTRPAAERMRRAAEEAVREVRTEAFRMKDRLGEEASAHMEKRMTVTDAGIAFGVKKVEASNDASAYYTFAVAYRLAEESRRLMEAKIALGIDTGLDRVGTTENIFGITTEGAEEAPAEVEESVNLYL